MVPILEEDDQLKCACAECGHVITYMPFEAGKVVECPKCKKKSQLPALPARPAASPAEPDEPPVRRCPACGSRLPPGAVACPTCETRRRRTRAIPVPLLAGGAVFMAVVAIAVVLAVRHLSRSSAGRTVDNSRTLPQVIPQPRVRTPKSTNDFVFRMFVVDQRRKLVTGDIINASENLYRQLRVDLDLLDANGVRVGSLSHKINELPANQTWHVVLSTSDPKAASVRITGIREEP